MKKLFPITLLVILFSSIIFSSCTEEQIKVTTTDNNGKTETGDRPTK